MHVHHRHHREGQRRQRQTRQGPAQLEQGEGERDGHAADQGQLVGVLHQPAVADPAAHGGGAQQPDLFAEQVVALVLQPALLGGLARAPRSVSSDLRAPRPGARTPARRTPGESRRRPRTGTPPACRPRRRPAPGRSAPPETATKKMMNATLRAMPMRRDQAWRATDRHADSRLQAMWASAQGNSGLFAKLRVAQAHVQGKPDQGQRHQQIKQRDALQFGDDLLRPDVDEEQQRRGWRVWRTFQRGRMVADGCQTGSGLPAHRP